MSHVAPCQSGRSLCQRTPISTEIFSAGWLLGQMDIAGGIFAAALARGRTATVAVDAMTFRKPVFVGNVMCIYTDLVRIGKTSITVHVEAWVIRRNETNRVLVTDGNFTYVALNDERFPRIIERQGEIVHADQML